MKRGFHQRNTIGCTPREERVLHALGTDRLTLTALARETGIPRQTIHDILARLKARGWVSSCNVGNQKRWMKVAPEIHMEQLQHTLGSLFSNQSFTDLRHRDTTEVHFVEGKDMSTHYVELFTKHLPLKKRIQAVQPTKSAHQQTKALNLSQTIVLNETIKKNKLVMEGILAQNYYTESTQQYGLDWLKSFDGRAASTVTLPDDFLGLNVEVYYFDQKVLICNWFDQTGLSIQNPALVQVFKHYLDLLSHSGRKLDQQEHITSLIRKYQPTQ